VIRTDLSFVNITIAGMRMSSEQSVEGGGVLLEQQLNSRKSIEFLQELQESSATPTLDCLDASLVLTSTCQHVIRLIDYKYKSECLSYCSFDPHLFIKCTVAFEHLSVSGR